MRGSHPATHVVSYQQSSSVVQFNLRFERACTACFAGLDEKWRGTVCDSWASRLLGSQAQLDLGLMCWGLSSLYQI